MKYYIEGITKKYATFSGRARRKEFWMFLLFCCIVGVILAFVDGLLGLTFSTDAAQLPHVARFHVRFFEMFGLAFSSGVAQFPFVLSFHIPFAEAFGLTLSEDEAQQGILSSIYSLAVLIPLIAMSVRRLHDIGKSGWWLLIGMVPAIGVILLFVWYCLDSQATANPYGPNPKLGS